MIVSTILQSYKSIIKLKCYWIILLNRASLNAFLSLLWYLLIYGLFWTLSLVWIHTDLSKLVSSSHELSDLWHVLFIVGSLNGSALEMTLIPQGYLLVYVVFKKDGLLRGQNRFSKALSQRWKQHHICMIRLYVLSFESSLFGWIHLATFHQERSHIELLHTIGDWASVRARRWPWLEW